MEETLSAQGSHILLELIGLFALDPGISRRGPGRPLSPGVLLPQFRLGLREERESCISRTKYKTRKQGMLPPVKQPAISSFVCCLEKFTCKVV